jgi:MFS family permease
MTAAADDDSVPARRMLRLLLDRDIGPFFAARMSSSIGIWIHNVVAAIVVFQLSGSVTLVALVSIAQFGPQIALGPWGGMLADRWNRIAQATIGRLTASAGAAGLAALIFIGGMDALEPWHVIVAALVVGIGFAISIPALQALVPSLGTPGEVGAVVALDTIPATVARAAGPAIGGILLLTSGPATAFAVSAASQLLMALAIWLVQFRPVMRTPSADQSVLGGIRHLRVDPALATMLLGVTGIGLGIDPAVTLAPALAEEFGAGTEVAAALMVAFGLGAVLTSCVIGPVRRRWPRVDNGTLGLAVLAASLALVSVGPWPEWAVFWLGVGGVGMFLGATGYTTSIQKRLPEHLRGRIMALWSIAFLGSRPLSAAIDGVIADVFSVHAAFAVMAGVLGAIALVGWLQARRLAL